MGERVVYIEVLTLREQRYTAESQGFCRILSVCRVYVGGALNLQAVYNLFRLCNILSPNSQRRHSFRIENWLDQMRDLRREIFLLPAYAQQRNVKHLEDFTAEVEH